MQANSNMNGVQMMAGLRPSCLHNITFVYSIEKGIMRGKREWVGEREGEEDKQSQIALLPSKMPMAHGH